MSSTSSSSSSVSLSGSPSSTSDASSTSDGSASASSAQASCTGSGCDQGFAPPAALYLYTFLTTLLILLFVSAGIVLRSVYLRRQMRIAIANGTWVPPPTIRVGGVRSSRRGNPYAKLPVPKIFDTYLAWEKDSGDITDTRWRELQPFCALPAPEPEATRPPPAPPPPPPFETPAPARRLSLARRIARPFVAAFHYFYPPDHEPAPTPTPPEPDLPLPGSHKPKEDQSAHPPEIARCLQLALLIAMPVPFSSRDSRSDDADEPEEELPYVEFAVLDVDVADSSDDSISLPGGKVPMPGSDEEQEAGAS
ncbi:hypothetical protein HMN09_00573300 [Mycena chlorophos]|uniref:Uncharacterized protein n=1 Tax=Mycena chlorophos TaxID=658473 RepID=A0A8H6TCD7_MYCCL|nr:hypothetical protein HMN09_00573300 [Mycena chlorophos]